MLARLAMNLFSGIACLLFAAIVHGQGSDVRGPRQAAPKSPGIPLGTPRRPATGRYRYQNGRWWYLSPTNQWSLWQDGRWVRYAPQRPSGAGGPRSAIPSPEFERRFATYSNYPLGAQQLRTAEEGGVELATDEINVSGEGNVVAEAMEAGGIPRRQAERQHTGIRRAVEEIRPDWFQSGSPFGVRYGYGSGSGYSGYGYNNPYGYGPRTGSGGAFSYGFGPYGAVGGQTSARMSGMGAESRNLISAKPSGTLGAPSGLERGPVGGSITRTSRRRLGGSASSSGPRD